INSERKHVRHTVIFFIFIVSNIGGVLLPVGDPPLFLGYLRGVPFYWTLKLLPQWALCVGVLLILYFIWDCAAYKKERPEDLRLDETKIQPIRLHGLYNFIWLAGVVAIVASMVPGQRFPGTTWTIPNAHFRELMLLSLAGLSYFTTPKQIH